MHMQGASYLAWKASTRLMRNHPGVVTLRQCYMVSVAALLHDIGHGPFSHDFELTCKAINVPFVHEDMTLVLIDHMRSENRHLDDVFGADEWREIKACIIGKPTVAPWMGELVSGMVDVDKIDYTVRDFLFIGRTSPMCAANAHHILHHMHLDDSLSIVFSVDALRSIAALYMARQILFDEVCMHRTVIGMKLLLTMAVSASAELREKVTLAASNPEEFLKLTDNFIHNYLSHTKEGGMGPFLARKIEYERSIPACLGILSSKDVKAVPRELLALCDDKFVVSSVCVGFGKTSRNVLLDLKLIKRDGDVIKVEEFLAQTVIPDKCLVFKHYVFANPRSLHNLDDLRSMQNRIKEAFSDSASMVWTCSSLVTPHKKS
jgi:HD superfamily phosphohydrolase